jgi:hypothetical protein
VAAAPVEPAASSAAARPAAAASSAAPSAPGSAAQPFAAVVRGATRQDGLLPLWKRDDKVWIELSPQALARPYFLSPKLSTGIGEAGFFGGLMAGRQTNFGRPQLVRLRRVGNQVQVLAENAAHAARPGSEAAHAVAAAFSPSLLASVPVASQPDAQGAVLIDAQALFVADLQGVGMLLQRAYRQGYAFDARNSSLATARASARSLVVEVQGHYASASLSAGGGTPAAGAPATVPDARSLFITTHYTLLALPEQPMAARRADARVGHFITTVADYSDERLRSPRLHHVNRWRLDKRDPQAGRSPPVQPIVFWLDRSIPQRWRDTVRASVLAWNAAFERIGFEGALEVREQPGDGSIDTLEAGQASIRWMTNASQTFDAIGPSHVDPRTGEILDADIALESLATRSARDRRAQLLDDLAGPAAAHEGSGKETGDASACHLHADAAGLGLALAAARDGPEPDSAEAEAFVQAYLKYLVMHEVGHALGLRHNFRGSTAFGAAELADPAFTAAHGTSASVMDYVAVNLALPGRPQPAPYPTTLGAYDLWAIEYAYKPLPPEQETAELQRIAARVQEPAWQPLLAYANDEDLALGLDPQALAFDLGRDPLAFARQRLALAGHTLGRLAARPPAADDAARLRRVFGHVLAELSRAAISLARQVGGVRTRREAAGTAGPVLDPVPAPRQRAALDLLLGEFLRPRALMLPGPLQQRLGPDFLERDAGGSQPTDLSLTQTVATLQRFVLSQLMSDETTASLLDSQDKDPQAFALAALHRRLVQAVWQDAPPPGAPPSWTRELQREHVNRLAGLIVRPGSTVVRAEARSLWLATGRQLLARLRSQAGRTADPLVREHLRDCADTLARALSAPALRSAP